ncbi:8279_t:CDS:1, partial [Gigaspora margarita]
MPFANIRISRGSKILYGWFIHPIPYEMSVKEFFQKLTEEISVPNLDFEQVKSIEISKSANSTEATPTSSDCNIIELTNIFGTNIHYRLKEQIIFHNYQNGLDILMQTARQNNKLYIPNFAHPEKPNRKQLLRLDIVNWIKSHNSGWSTQT